MDFALSEYIAIGFPLVIGILLIIFFPKEIFDSSTQSASTALKSDPTTYKLSTKQSIYIFLVYLTSVTVLGLIQAFLFWHFAVNPEVLFTSRFTDYIFYPYIVSALMGIFVMWFVFTAIAYSRGEDYLSEYLNICFDGWNMKRQIGRFKYLVLTAALASAAANFWAYNIFLSVTDSGIVVSNHRMLHSHNFGYERLDSFTLEWHRQSEENEFFVLALNLVGGGYVRTDWNMFYNENMLEDIDNVITTASMAKGEPIYTLLTEIPKTPEKEVSDLFSND